MFYRRATFFAMKLFSQRLSKNSEQAVLLNEPVQIGLNFTNGQNEQSNTADQSENDIQGEIETNEIDNAPVDYRLIDNKYFWNKKVFLIVFIANKRSL